MLKICFSQFEVEPGHPDLNFSKMLQAINEAKQNHADIIIFPEMVIPGYLLGDTWEQTSYLKDCLAYGDDIIAQSDDICIIFGNIAMKLCKYGLLYSSSDHLQDIRDFSSDKSLWDELIPSESFLIPLKDYSNLFRISTSPDIYLCDLFGIADSHNTLDQDQTLPKTKSSDVIYNDYLQRSPFLKQTYTVPNSTDAQRHIFPSDTKVANDTKVYYENFAVYSERGVKTKTVRKKLLGWQKFDNNLNNTVYDGQSYIIATKVISGLPGDVINMSHSDLVEECNDALTWAKNKGINVSNIDGLRLIGLEDPANVLVRIKDDVRTVYDSKCTIIVNLKPEGSFYTETSSLGAYTIMNNAYRIFQVSWAGYSDYNGERRGTRVIYIE